MSRFAVAVTLAAAACAAPVAADRQSVLTELATRYPAFFPDGGGLVRPRFGDPDIARVGGAIAIELLRRDGDPPPRVALVAPELADVDARACIANNIAAPGCWPLALAETGRERVDARTSELAFAATVEAPVGGYDLVVDGQRARRAVWLRADDPAVPRPLHVVQLSDLHVGKNRSAMAHLAQVISDVNALQPDLVIVTGDLVDHGEDPALAPLAAWMLQRIDAPILTIMGNHDVGRSFGTRVRRRYGVGWEYDARAFHPLMSVSLALGGWEFVGFETGPGAGLGTRINVRGIGKDTIAELRALLDDARRAGRRGVVLASHAPTRTSLFGGPGNGRGTVGRMSRGGDALERLMLEAGASGQRVIHLAGHTHWSDVYEEQVGRRGPHFTRWAALSPCPHELRGYAALVTTQSASVGGLPAKTSARGYGYAELWLDDTVRIAHHRYGASLDRRVCPQ